MIFGHQYFDGKYVRSLLIFTCVYEMRKSYRR